jgi:hypothetical protein
MQQFAQVVQSFNEHEPPGSSFVGNHVNDRDCHDRSQHSQGGSGIGSLSQGLIPSSATR